MSGSDESIEDKEVIEKLCSYCNKPDARKKCKCKKRRYCDEECQRRHWKTHRDTCSSRKVKPNISVIKEEEEEEHLCPICLDNADNATVDGNDAGICFACGQSYCGMCNFGGLTSKSPNCPTCRAPFAIPAEEQFKRCWKLVYDRSPGRHTPMAQVNLGYMYHKGKGVRQDFAKAAKYYKLAVDQGNAFAQCNLGIMYDNGRGVPQDDARAGQYYKLAADQGNADAQCNLGVMYDEGCGVKQDNAKAAKYYKLSAVQGDDDGLYNLDLMQEDHTIRRAPSIISIGGENTV